MSLYEVLTQNILPYFGDFSLFNGQGAENFYILYTLAVSFVVIWFTIIFPYKAFRSIIEKFRGKKL